MTKKIQEYIRPANWEEATAALRRLQTNAAPLIVGPRPAALEAREAEAVLDLRRLGLAYVKQSGDGIHIGALTPLQDLAESSVLQATADGLLSEAAGIAGGLGIRHAASVAGALAESDGPPEVALALLALGAVIVVRPAAGGQRDMAVANYLAGGEGLLEEIKFAAQPGAAGALQRVARTPRDQAVVAVATTVEAAGGVCRAARIAVAGAGPRPVRMEAVEAALAGKLLDDKTLSEAAAAVSAAAQPAGDYRGSAAYRKAMAGTLARRALAEAWRRAGAA
jgi:carbon-monoxide dehydrogenase medium subunit